MTALVFLESGAPLDQMVTVQRSDVSRASTTYLRNGFKLTAEDLLNLLLVGSDNAAARALARVSPMGYDGFIESMNEPREAARPREHELRRSVGPARRKRVVGLRPGAADRLRRRPTSTSARSCARRRTRRNIGKRMITANSTNQIVRSGDIDVVGGKTGFISRSGLLPGHAAAPAAVGPAGGVRRARREDQRQPLLGNASPVQLDEHADQGAARRRLPAAATAAD